ncbi:MAG: Rieske 2Fe-2S domain-containing protein [Actinomycetota bacterium]
MSLDEDLFLYPTGWFQIAYRNELAPGEVQPRRYFGRDLVLYRGESGQYHVLDAFCGHLGAHLGHGGRVCADDIVCPFHGWRWSCEGANVDIPYSERTNSRKQIRPWRTAEASGSIWLWHDALGEEPTYDPPDVPEAEDSDYYPAYPHCLEREYLAFPVQALAENAVDFAHFQFVHKAGKPTEIADYGMDGPKFHVLHRLEFGLERGQTWLTPDGKPVVAEIDLEVHGVGVIVGRFKGTDEAVHFGCAVPVDHDVSEMRSAVLVRREPGDTGDAPTGVARARVEHQQKQAHRDYPILSHLRYDPTPGFALEEARVYGAFRKWSAQFYENAAVARERGLLEYVPARGGIPPAVVAPAYGSR